MCTNRISKSEKVTNWKKEAVAKALNSCSMTMPSVRCRRHRYASIMACAPIVSSDTLATPACVLV